MDRPSEWLSRIRLDALNSEWLSSHHVEAAILRLDLMDPDISGNKWFKLQHNIRAAEHAHKKALLTFGGPYSNHLVAVAAAAHQMGWGSIGLVRGTYPQMTPGLEKAASLGMIVHRLDKGTYTRKQEPAFLEAWQTRYPEAFIVPEGGSNLLGAEGCTCILDLVEADSFSHICCSMGTGTTMAGLLNHPTKALRVGFPAIKGGGYLTDAIRPYLKHINALESLVLMEDYHFGGFARYTDELLTFMNDFYHTYGIGLDRVYTGKLAFGVFDLISQGYFPKGSRILLIHTGGLQGNRSLPHGVLHFQS